MTAREQAMDLLRRGGAETIVHPGGLLLDHLVRTETTLEAWGANDDVCLAGLCHAVYGTDGFPVAVLPLSSRPVVRAAIGSGAEAIVYRYDACDRRATYATFGTAPVTFVDRFTSTSESVTGADMHAFAIITIANELDLIRVGAFDEHKVAAFAEFFQILAPYAPTAAEIALAEIAAR